MHVLTDREAAYQKLSKKPLRIDVYLGTPLVLPEKGIHLDSLLTEVVARELFAHDLDRWQNQDKHIDLPLPLEKTEGNQPIWKASIGFSSSLSREYQDFWVKRTNDQFAPYVTNKIVWPAGVVSDEVSKSLAIDVRLEHATGPANDPGRGGFKSYYESRNLIAMDKLIFHAVGNANEVERLLNKLTGVGKKTAIGFGQIQKIEVSEVNEDYSLFTPDNKAARNLPVEDFQPLQAQMIASRTTAPYWSKRNLVLCYAPSSPLPMWKWDESIKATESFEDDWFDEEDDENWFDD